MKNLFLTTVTILLLSSCSSKTLKPLYTTKPLIKELPKVEKLAERKIPNDERLALSISLDENAKPDSDDYFNNPGAKKSANGKLPSVIIAPPKEVEILGEKVKEFEQGQDDLDKIFKTDGYFNEAEQAVEKALLKVGFNVLDRSKFEAKLRDLRDRANDRPWWYSRWTEQLLENGEYDVIKDHYKKEFSEGKITPQKYAEVIDQVDKQSQRGLPGKKREEDEMNDIAEVIRAAQTGTDQAEYLLQINEVVVADAGDRFLSLIDNTDVNEFMNDHHGLKFGELPRSIPSYIPSNWLRASFNAKLIEVKTGSIVWIGSHEIESSAAEPIRISFNIDKNISNEDEVNGHIQKYNRDVGNLEEKLNLSQSKLSNLYEKAQLEKKFNSTEEMENYKTQLVEQLRSTKKEYNDNLLKLVSLTENSPSLSHKNWAYTYDVSSPTVTPDLLAFAQLDIQGEQKLLQHRKALIKKVTHEIISTIEIK